MQRGRISSNSFKKYERGRRIQLPDDIFTKGINFTTKPLGSSLSRLLVNFDIGNDGASALPRKGLQTFEVSQQPTDDLVDDYNENTEYTIPNIYDAQEISEENGVIYRRLMVGNLDEGQETTVKQGDLEIITIAPEENSETVKTISNITSFEQSVNEPEEGITYKYFFNSPIKAEIHKIFLENPENIAKHIGATISIEGIKRYFCFREKTDNTGETPVVTKELAFTTFENGKYNFEKLNPQTITARNASLSMYNMLSDNPYSFTDTLGGSVMDFKGVYVTDLSGNQRQATYINTEYKFRMNYAVPASSRYKVVWEWKEVQSDNYEILAEQEFNTFPANGTPPAMEITFASPSTSIIIKVSAYKWEEYNVWDPETKANTAMEGYNPLAKEVMLASVVFGTALGDSNQNLELVNYDLSTCTDMTDWQQRLVVASPTTAKNMLFVSEPNNPAWFPYPRNAIPFPDNIIKCIPYLNNLLVFTTSELYMVSLDETGDSFIRKCIQKNLYIKEEDVNLIHIIKNMVLFKSNNYFYLVVPSASATMGISIAPISKPIEQFLDNFAENVHMLLTDVYDITEIPKLLKFESHVNYNNVQITYTFSVKNTMFNLYLIYDIASRIWKIYIIETKSFLFPYSIDVIQSNIYVTPCPLLIEGKISWGYQFLKFSEFNYDMFIYPFTEYDTDFIDYRRANKVLPNYNYVDSGYRELDSDNKKRFREIQFKINNLAQVDLRFYTKFFIDGFLRQDDSAYTINQIVDPLDPKVGTITYNRVFTEESGQNVGGATILGETELIESEEGLADAFGVKYLHNPEEEIVDNLLWRLDVSAFPDTVFWKIRFPVTGKGYTPRLTILNINEENFEILNINWVFRTLYSR